MSFVRNCELFYQVSFDSLYRYGQFYTLIASTVAVFPLTYVITYKLGRCSFNKNVKWLYQLYFIEILLSVVNNIVVFSHHVLAPFIASSKCDLIIDPDKNRVLQAVGVFGVSCPVLTIVGISVERVFALIFARVYENCPAFIGVAIGILAVVGDMAILWMFLSNERFDQPSISYFLVPDTSGYKMNILCWSLLLANALNFLFNVCLVKANTILKKKWRTSLSVRYQMEENIITTKFSTFISFCHVSFFSLYLILTICIRYIGPYFFTTAVDLFSIRGIYITIPTYNMLIGVASCLMLRHLKGKQVAKVYAETKMDYGEHGYKKHNDAIFHIWKTKETY